MRSGWNQKRLGEIVGIRSGYPFKSSDFTENGIPVVKIANIKDGSVDLSQCSFVSLETAERALEFNLSPNDLLITLTGNVGEIGRVREQGPLVLNQRVGKIDLRSNLSDLRFIEVFLRWEPTRSTLISLAAGLAQPNISPRQVAQIEIALPPLAEQRRIVDVIESVDNYITAQETRAETARTARSALLHELLSNPGPDWVETTLGAVADYVNGFPFKPSDLGDSGLPVIRIKQLLDPLEPTDRSEIATPERCHLRDGDIVFSWSGTLAVRRWDRGAALLNQHLFRVLEKPGVDRAWLIAVLDHAITELDEKSHGTTMKHITKQTLLPHKVFLPPLIEQKHIAEVVESLDRSVSLNDDALMSARNLRAALLSDLLSGNHEIPASYDQLLGAA